MLRENRSPLKKLGLLVDNISLQKVLECLSSVGEHLETLEVGSKTEDSMEGVFLSTLGRSCPELKKVSFFTSDTPSDEFALRKLCQLYELCPHFISCNCSSLFAIDVNDNNALDCWLARTVLLSREEKELVFECMRLAIQRSQCKLTLSNKPFCGNFIKQHDDWVLMKSKLSPYLTELNGVMSESILIEAVKKLPRLEKLTVILEQDRLTDLSLSVIIEYGYDLKTLYIGCLRYRPEQWGFSDEMVSKVIRSCELLEELRITGVGYESVLAVKHHSRLRTVYLDDVNVSKEEMSIMLELDEREGEEKCVWRRLKKGEISGKGYKFVYHVEERKRQCSFQPRSRDARKEQNQKVITDRGARTPDHKIGLSTSLLVLLEGSRPSFIITASAASNILSKPIPNESRHLEGVRVSQKKTSMTSSSTSSTILDDSYYLSKDDVKTAIAMKEQESSTTGEGNVEGNDRSSRSRRSSSYKKQQRKDNEPFSVPWWLDHLPKVNLHFDPLVNFKLKQRLMLMGACVTLGLDYLSDIAQWRSYCTIEDSLVRGRFSLRGSELGWAKSWLLNLGLGEENAAKLKLRLGLNLKSYKLYAKLRFRTEPISPFDIGEGLSCAGKLPLPLYVLPMLRSIPLRIEYRLRLNTASHTWGGGRNRNRNGLSPHREEVVSLSTGLGAVDLSLDELNFCLEWDEHSPLWNIGIVRSEPVRRLRTSLPSLTFPNSSDRPPSSSKAPEFSNNGFAPHGRNVGSKSSNAGANGRSTTPPPRSDRSRFTM
eukprot:scaffold12006_cov162-Ochromonas_danica.AAC.1